MMDEGVLGGLGRLGYNRARQLMLSVGLLILLLTAGIMYIRRVEAVEVWGTLLFIPVFVAVVFWHTRGGLIAGVLAALAYVALRYPAIDAVGAGVFAGRIASRSIAFIIFGLVGGWANKQLETSLEKLELYDQIDDYTGLFNARFFVQDTDLELSRSKRYQTIFSISLVSFEAASMNQLSRRQRLAIRRDLGRMLKEAVRTVDRAVHGFDGTNHNFACVLPETGPEGARIFTTRLAERMSAFLEQRGVHLPEGGVTHRWLTFPEDGEESVQELRRLFAEIDRHEHPEGSEGAAA
jgi:GGDEF domain-containing protein